MGLAAVIPTEFGVNATYWHIGAVSQDYRTKTCEVLLFGYVTKVAQERGKLPIASVKVSLSGNDFRPDADRATLYAILVNKPEFLTAEAI
jgi:hypothetical protein